MILGLLEPTTGRCEVFGIPSVDVSSRCDVGYLPEAPFFYRNLSGREFVRYCGRISGVPKGGLSDRVEEVLELVGLKDAAGRRIGTYSKGMLQRVGFAQALVHDPRLLILDEPTAGVDPIGSSEIAELILRLKSDGKTVVLCSHLLAQVEGVCDRIGIMNRGRLVLEGGVDELLEDTRREALIVERFPHDSIEEFRGWLEARGGRLASIERPRTSLDRVFVEQVSRLEGRGSGKSVSVANNEVRKGEQ
jgi:ABC-2 type transport system ATP-binding protein